MADAAISAVLFKLGQLAVSEAIIHIQLNDSIHELRCRLQWLQAFVRDDDRKRRAGNAGQTHSWVCRTRDFAFDAEDALDDLFNEKVTGSKYQGGRRRWKDYFITCLFKKVVVQDRLVGQIKMIKSRLDEISVNQREIQILHPASMLLASYTIGTAACRWDSLENAMVFDQNIKILKQMLVRKNERSLYFFMRKGPQHPMFISIVGYSGAGKNALAKIIHREMRSHMTMLLRCDMEPGSSTADFLGKVYERASLLCYDSERMMIAEQEGWDIADKLRRLLGGKRYLLILGGISSISILNCVTASLPDPKDDNNSGGCVMLILDTENEEVAWHANTMNIQGVNGVHLLTHLDQKRTGQLFLWKVSRMSQYHEDDGKYSELVYSITGGYPMAIVLLAGLLRFKEKPAQWEAVLHQLQLESVYPPPLHSNIRAIEFIFWASFEDLPSDIKFCFLYFAAYPNNTCQYADELVRMWIGEGFIEPQNRKTMVEVGNDYLKELVLRCLVEVEQVKADGGIQLVRVHKSLMGFLLSEVRTSGFMEIINDSDMHGFHVPPSARRLSIQSYYSNTNANKKFSKLHSFICHIINKNKGDKPHSDNLEYLWSSRFIRIISVQGLRLERLSDRIGDMINLRYLRISSRFLQELPSSISRLLNLQTLDIRNTEVKEIDLDVWKIKTLQHVLATNLMLPTTMKEHEGGAGGSELQTLHGVRLNISRFWSAGNCPLDKMTSLLSLELEMEGFEEERDGLSPGLETEGFEEERDCVSLELETEGIEEERYGMSRFKAALQNMPLLGHLYLKGHKIPSCVFTHPSLQSLKTMVLHGSVEWNKIVSEKNLAAGHLLRRNRPNLIDIKLRYTNEVPEIIKQQLGTILIKDD